MINAAIKALTQMFSRPFRTVLLKSVGLALVLLVLLGIGLQRLFVWFAAAGESWAAGLLGQAGQNIVIIVSWIVSIAATLGIVAGAILLMPAVSAFVASFFVDDIAMQVERNYYRSDRLGEPLPVTRAGLEGAKTALLALGIYILALPFLLLAGVGVVIFFLATAFLLGREYFELVAMRHHSVADAKRLRSANRRTVFFAGLFIALFVSIPIINLATPLFGTAFMVHVYKRMMRNE